MLHKIDGIWYKHWETTFINNCAIENMLLKQILREIGKKSWFSTKKIQCLLLDI